MNFVETESEAPTLPVHDRAALAQPLLLILEDFSEPRFEQLWADESTRRVAEFDARTTTEISGTEVAMKTRALLR
jgi:hypothetical protein